MIVPECFTVEQRDAGRGQGERRPLRRITIASARVLVLGITFKENCPDLRNTRVIDLVRELQRFGAAVDVHDPWPECAEGRTALRHRCSATGPSRRAAKR
jgi:UDP-N-acetyl-D-mannosaminuronate dehydrogenase